MKRINIILGLIMASTLTLCTACSSSDHEEEEETAGLEGITISNFPVIDGSDSTTPLRYMLMCKAVGFDYEWTDSPFSQDGCPKTILPDYNCTDEERRHLGSDCMKESNTHDSFMNLIDGTVELIITARSISRDEKNAASIALIEKPIARDALAFMVNAENPVNSLTTKQIQDIYTGKIKNWSEVGGNDVAITPYVRNRNSGSQEKFETMVMDGLTIADVPEMQIGSTMMTPYYQLEWDANGLAFTPFYFFSVLVNNGKTKVLGIDGVPMTKDNIENGTYPYLSDVYAVVRSDIDKSSVAYQLFKYLTTKSGQALIKESGYVPQL